VVGILAYYARGREFNSRTVQTFVCRNISVSIGSGFRQSNNLKTIAKLERYKMYGIDTSRDKSCDFDLVSFTSCLTLTAKLSLSIDKIYFLTFKQFTITIATTMLHCLPNCFRYLCDDDEFRYRFALKRCCFA
jgi:hypothetical protein